MNYRTTIPYGENILIKCPNCLYEGEPKRKRRGNIIIEILLWILIIPGIIYTIRRGINSYCKCPRCNSTHLEEIDGNGELVEKLVKLRKMENGLFWVLFIVFFIISFLVRDRFEKNITRNNSLNNSSQNNSKSNNNIWNFNDTRNYDSVSNNFKIDVDSPTKNMSFWTNTSDSEEERIRKNLANELIQQINSRGPKGYIPLEGLIGLECVGDCLDLHVLIKTSTEPEEKYGVNNLTLFGKQLSSSLYWKANNFHIALSNEFRAKLVSAVDIIIDNKLSYICLCKQGLDCNKCIDVKKIDKFDGSDTYNDEMIKTLIQQFSLERKEDTKFLKAYCNGACLSGDINVDYVEGISTGYPYTITNTAKELASEIHYILRRYVDLPISVHIRGGDEIKLTCTASSGEIATCN